jgi:heptosyltransferase-2
MTNSAFAVIQAKPGIGDTIWHLPFIRAIAAIAPSAQVTFLAPRTSMARELLAAEPSVSEVLYFVHDGGEIARSIHLFQLARLLRSRRFQRIYILDRTTRPAFAACVARIPERIGVGWGMQRLWITNHGIDNHHFHEHPIAWLNALFKSEKINLDSLDYDLVIPNQAVSSIKSRFGSPAGPWIVLGLGASHPSKDWPDAHWVEFLRRLSQLSRSTIFLIGGLSWHSRADRLIAKSGAAAINACDLPIMSSAALIRKSQIFVGPDSGPLNIAAAVGTRAYGIFGPTPSLTYSRHIQEIRAREDLSRTPMIEVMPDRVLSVVLPALQALAS